MGGGRGARTSNGSTRERVRGPLRRRPEATSARGQALSTAAALASLHAHPHNAGLQLRAFSKEGDLVLRQRKRVSVRRMTSVTSMSAGRSDEA